ncbi:ethionine resistance protein [Sorochytrium milnesiophthora]
MPQSLATDYKRGAGVGRTGSSPGAERDHDKKTDSLEEDMTAAATAQIGAKSSHASCSTAQQHSMQHGNAANLTRVVEECVPDYSMSARPPPPPPISTNVAQVCNTVVGPSPDDNPAALRWMPELLRLLRLAVPCISSYVLGYANKLLVTLAVGHLGAKELAAATLAITFTNVFGFSICFGISTALDTLASQAVTGAASPRVAGVYLQRSIVINLLLAIPIAVLWYHSEALLLLARQDATLSALAGNYTRLLVWGLAPNIIQNNLIKFLQAQGLMDAAFYITLVVFPVNLLLQWLLVWYPPTRMGFYGAPVASVIADTVSAIGAALYITYINGHQCWHPWSWKALQEWGQFIALGFPGMLMMCAEWWMFEAAALMAGWFGDKALAAQAVLLNTGAVVYMVYLAISVVNSNRIGNFLGAGKPHRARMAAHISFSAALLVAMVNSSLLVAVRHVWGHIFSDDPEVIALVAALLPISALFQFCDGGCAVASGVLRGCGKQTIGAAVNLVAYYVVGMPLCIFFTFRLELGIAGIWWGLAAALLAALIGQGSYILYGINWDAEVAKARARMLDDIDNELPVDRDRTVEDALLGEEDEEEGGVTQRLLPHRDYVPVGNGDDEEVILHD